MLETVLQYGTGKAAAIGQFAAGKTGTTSNYGDAWFVGWDSKYTVAVWVGYPNKLIPMTTDFNGNPVLGGTFPALIWHDFMTSALQIDKNRAEAAAAKNGSSGKTGPSSTSTGSEEAGSSPSTGSTSGQGPSPAGAGKTTGKPSTPSAPGNGAGGGAPNATPEHAAAAPSTPAPADEAPSAPPPPAAAPAAPASPSPTGGVSPGG
jgi:penicillin-binding protein 1A